MQAIKTLEGGKYYKKANDNNDDDLNDRYYLPVYKISTECRATTSDIGKDRKDKLAGSIISITPTMYYAKEAGASDISLQPALLLGFFDDIVSVGPGFNLSGPERERYS